MACVVVVVIRVFVGLVVEQMQEKINFIGLKILIRVVRLQGLNLIPAAKII